MESQAPNTTPESVQNPSQAGLPPVPPAVPAVPKKNNGPLIIAIVLWAIALPLSIVITILGRVIADDASVRAVINILSLLLGMYVLLGWIPVVITAIKRGKK